MQKIAPIILLSYKDYSLLVKRNFDIAEAQLRPCQKIHFFTQTPWGLAVQWEGESGRSPKEISGWVNQCQMSRTNTVTTAF